MRIKRRPPRIYENAAMADLAFLLIIYFIVIAGFNVNRGFLMNLPRKGLVQTVMREELLTFTLDENGALFLRGRPIGFDEAEGEIKSALKERPNTAVLVFVSGSAPWQSVVSFVELAGRGGAESLSFRMEESGAEESGMDEIKAEGGAGGTA